MAVNNADSTKFCKNPVFMLYYSRAVGTPQYPPTVRCPGYPPTRQPGLFYAQKHLLSPTGCATLIELNETFEKCVKITKIIGNFYDVIPAKAGIHGVSLWIPDISLREIPE